MSKYTSENELDHFNFHDAIFKDVTFLDSDMVWTLEEVSVTTDNSQCNHECDMKASTMHITFYNYKINMFATIASKHIDRQGKLIKEIPSKVVPKETYETTLPGLIDLYMYLNHGNTVQSKVPTHHFEIGTGGPYYDIEISYYKAVAEWDTYEGKAWYVRDAERIAASKKYVADSSDPI